MNCSEKDVARKEYAGQREPSISGPKWLGPKRRIKPPLSKANCKPIAPLNPLDASSILGHPKHEAATPRRD